MTTIYKVRVYTKEMKSSWVYAVRASSKKDAINAAKMRIITLGFTPYRAYVTFELDGILDASKELPF